MDLLVQILSVIVHRVVTTHCLFAFGTDKFAPEQLSKPGVERFATVRTDCTVAVFLVLAALGKMLEGVFRLVMLGWLNKLLGVLFALLKTALIVGLLIIAFTSVNDTFRFVQESVLNESVLYPPLKKLAFDVFPYVKDMLSLGK